jgi:hypothetical protein
MAIAFFVGLLFYVTSADSGALVMANLCSRLRSVQDDAAPWMRIVWAAVTGLLTIAMLLVGGILALQYATIIFAVPFAIVALIIALACAGAIVAGVLDAAVCALELAVVNYVYVAAIFAEEHAGCIEIDLRIASAKAEKPALLARVPAETDEYGRQAGCFLGQRHIAALGQTDSHDFLLM